MASNELRKQEAEVLKKFAARWAVLLAWQVDLGRRSRSVPAGVAGQLETAKIKISSGCFSPCEVGCDLRQIEAALTSADASLGDSQIDRWLEALSRVMGDDKDLEEIIKLPAIKIHFNECQSRTCGCSSY